ncbi:MAG: FtsX-like permease family protein, partial [Bacteroidota bacterium]
ISDEIIVGLPIMGLFMLALACLNYINMAIGSATKRLKEIGLRKVIGADRRRVVAQFMIEHILVAFLAAVLGLLLCATLFLPWFSGIAGSPLAVQWFSPQLWLFLIGLATMVGFVSGLYPALYVSKFQVVKIMKGTLRFGKNNPMMKAFLCFQMILAFVFITMAVMFYQNSEFQANRPWGYNQHGALYAQVGDRSGFEKLSAAMGKDPHVQVIAGSSHHLGSSVASTEVQWADHSNESQVMAVDGDYFATMGIEVVAGESFQGQSQKNQVMVNELFVETMSINQPIGSMLRMDSSQYQIVGVVKNLHAFNFYYEMRPMIFRRANQNDYQYLTMRVQEGTESETYDHLRAQWIELFPDTPFQGGQQVDLWTKFYSDLENMKRFTRTVAMVAILLAALGLYGLVSLNVTGRIKEF